MAEGMDANGEIDIANIKVIHVQEDPEFPFPYSTSLAAPEWPLAHLPHVPTVSSSVSGSQGYAWQTVYTHRLHTDFAWLMCSRHYSSCRTH